MLKAVRVEIGQIYIPTARRKTLDDGKVEALAEDILENGCKTPIQVRQGKDRYVLVEGLHRLEAMKALGESTIESFIVSARKA